MNCFKYRAIQIYELDNKAMKIKILENFFIKDLGSPHYHSQRKTNIQHEQNEWLLMFRNIISITMCFNCVKIYIMLIEY